MRRAEAGGPGVTTGGWRWLEGVSRWFCSPGGVAVMLALFTAAYGVATASLASLKPFSFDELSTFNIARMPTAGEVWAAWVEAGDGMPPVVHFATHLAGSALGFSHVTARLPAMVGFWVMCLCIFVFLRRRVCPLLAVMGMVLPVTVPLAYGYAYEARSYGMVLGLCGAAVVCWDLVHDRAWRGALVALPLCLAGAVATHVYAVLAIVPLGLAELARTRERRKVDWRVWGGLVAPMLVLLPVNPVIPHIRQNPELARYLDRPRVSVSALMELWGQFLSISITYLGLLALVAWWVGRAVRTDDGELAARGDGRRPPTDWVLVMGLVMLPAIGWLFANLVTRLLLFRYVVAAIIGFSLGVPLLCRMAVGRRPEIALLLASWVGITAAGSPLSARHMMRTTAVTTEHIAAGQGCFRLLKMWRNLPPDGLPIVVSDFIVFNQLHHYGPQPLKERLLFLADREFAELIEPYMPFYTRVFGQRMETPEGFLRSHRSFYLYDCGGAGRLPWVARLVGAGASLSDSGLLDTPEILLRRDFYRVSLPDDPTESVIRR